MQRFGIWLAGSIWRRLLVFVIVTLIGAAAVIKIVFRPERPDPERPVICSQETSARPERTEQTEEPEEPKDFAAEPSADETQTDEADSARSFVGRPVRDVFDAWGNTYEIGGYMGGYQVGFPERKAAVVLDKSADAWDAPLTGEETVRYELHWGDYPLEEAYVSRMTYAELAAAAEAAGSMIELSGRMEGYESESIAQIASVECGGLEYSYTWETGKKLSDPCSKVVIGYPHPTQLPGDSYQEAYRTVLNALQEEYGAGERDETGYLHGVVYAELLDFERSGTPALLCAVVPDGSTRLSNRLLLYVWNGEAARCILDTTVGVHYGTTDVYAPITVSEADGTVWIVIGNSEESSMEDECTAYTVKDGVLKLRLFYAANTEGETWPPYEENLDAFFIDGRSVSRETYFSQRNSLKEAPNAKVTDVLWQADPALVSDTLEQLAR